MCVPVIGGVLGREASWATEHLGRTWKMASRFVCGIDLCNLACLFVGAVSAIKAPAPPVAHESPTCVCIINVTHAHTHHMSRARTHDRNLLCTPSRLQVCTCACHVSSSKNATRMHTGVHNIHAPHLCQHTCVVLPGNPRENRSLLLDLRHV